MKNNFELVIRAQKHDKNAFVELIDNHRNSMYKISRAILKNEDDIADALQNTILICWEKIHTLKHPEYFKTWFTKILINECHAICRKKAQLIFQEEIEEKAYTDQDFSTVEWQEILDFLDEKQRIVVELYYAEQFKVREIAKILHISQSAVKGRLQAARRKLETYYRDLEAVGN